MCEIITDRIVNGMPILKNRPVCIHMFRCMTACIGGMDREGVNRVSVGVCVCVCVCVCVYVCAIYV